MSKDISLNSGKIDVTGMDDKVKTAILHGLFKKGYAWESKPHTGIRNLDAVGFFFYRDGRVSITRDIGHLQNHRNPLIQITELTDLISIGSAIMDDLEQRERERCKPETLSAFIGFLDQIKIKTNDQ